MDHIEKERSEVPGPGAYDLPNLDKNVSGGAFSLAEPPNDVDIAMRRAREVPGPGHYKLPDLGSDGGGALLLGLCPTDVDIAMRRSKEVPGPGKYPLKSTLDRGQTISKSAKVPIFKEILSRTTLVPSPACYAPDMSKPLVTNVGRHTIANVLIGRGKRTHFLDEVMRRSKTVPGHEYQVNGSSLKLSGGRFSTAKPKSDIEWKIYEASRLPGPKYSTSAKRSLSEQRQMRRDAEQTRRARDRILAQSGLIEPGVPVHERLYKRHLKTSQAARRRRKEREEESLYAKTHPLGEVRVHTLRRFTRKDEQRTPRDEPVKADVQASGPTFDAHGNNMKSVDLKMDGDQAMEDKSPAKALRCYSSALTLQPITEQLRNNILVRRAAALVKLESLDKALADLDQCLSSDPRHRRAHQRRGVVLSLLGRHKEAMSELLF